MIVINGTELKTTTFPNGEQKIKTPFLGTEKFDMIVLKWESDQDLMNLMFLKHFLNDIGRERVYLMIAYMPYSRMDRQIKGDVFTLKSICKFINALNFKEVIILEPHSDVTPALLDRCKVLNTTMDLFLQFEKSIKPDCVFYPDAGAQKRYHTSRYPNLVGNKVRNPQTGRIEQYDVLTSDVDVLDKTIVILDDLSSYGGTFVLAAKALKKLGAGDIYLVIAHAEKSILEGEIFSSGLIKKVITTNSIIDENNSNDQLLIEDII